MSKPTLVFAPGAWYPTTAFDPLIQKLPEYSTRTVAFPSIQQASTVQDLQPDINAVRSIVTEEVDAGRDVVVVLHSWAGLPVSSALDGLSKSERNENNQPGGVTRLIFLAAFIPREGESLIGAFGGIPPPWYVRDEANGTVMPSAPYDLFFHDAPGGQEWAATLRPHAWVTKNAPATGEAYFKIPSAYLLCEDDRAIPLAVQQLLVDRARRRGADIETEKISTSHSPWLVRPDEVAAYIRKNAGEQD
ncbi:hypothetical protein N7492_005601 [Penicillium capsulatum]|uniref:AB hydrolase-1 domain-containing protein n=1 Tax=Penicillium capsulatum TaxID=69766 RepID=A0A9W9IC68_9EURO|nr:hypothetical protein N7492_005601 [Penicillium capsulatum]KAJ6135300.1 hypothetical protein N7512_000460 [Penicillium capsulatum]